MIELIDILQKLHCICTHGHHSQYFKPKFYRVNQPKIIIFVYNQCNKHTWLSLWFLLSLWFSLWFVLNGQQYKCLVCTNWLIAYLQFEWLNKFYSIHQYEVLQSHCVHTNEANNHLVWTDFHFPTNLLPNGYLLRLRAAVHLLLCTTCCKLIHWWLFYKYKSLVLLTIQNKSQRK